MRRKSNPPLSAPQEGLKDRVQATAETADSMVFYGLLKTRLAGPLNRVLAEFQPEHRKRVYPPTLTLAMFLGQTLNADGSCRNAVAQANLNRLLENDDAASQNTASYCEARQRLEMDVVRSLRKETAAAMTEVTPESWLWRSRHPKLMDGSSVTMPDTKANQAKYPQHGGQEEGAGFPAARLMGVISLAHGGVLSMGIAPHKGKGTGELSLLREQMDCFDKDDVALGDALYGDYFTMADMLARGVDFGFEQHGARTTDFRRGQKLGKHDHVVILKKPKARPEGMTKQRYESYAKEITVREARVRGKVLVTSFVNQRDVNRRELGKLFAMRWNVELDIRNIKTTLGMDKLSCKTPEMCEKELEVYMLAYNLIRLLMAEGAVQAGTDPRKLSFKNTVQLWTAWIQRPRLADNSENLRALFKLIGQIRVGNRPGRIEPRVIKQRPKAFPRLKTTRRRARAQVRRRGHGRKRRAA
jgi:Transposase DDE domain